MAAFTVSFPGGVAVDATYEGHTLHTAIDHCAVKKHIVEPPRFELSLSDASREPAGSSGALQHA